MRKWWVLSIGMPILALAQTGPGGVGNSSNNFVWFSADHGVVAPTAGIQEWRDRSGTGNHATQATAANQPFLANNVINGYPAVLFDNDQVNYDFLTVPDNSTLEGMSGLTGFVVYRLLAGTAASAPRCFFSKRDGVDIQEAYDWFIWGGSSGSSANQQLDIVNTNNRIASSTAYTTGTTYLNSFVYHGAAPTNSSDQLLYDGNTLVGNGAESATSIPNYSSNLYIGILRGHTGTGGNVSRFNGYIAEIILYNESLNDVQRTIVNNYLAAKYGTTMATNDLYTMDNPGNGDFDHEVTGIGRSGTSVVDGSRGAGIVTMARTSGSIADNTYLFWGHDNGIMGAWGVHDIHTSLQGRLARLWRVSEVNTSGTSADVGNVDITFDLNGLGPVTAADLRLVVDLNEDGTMANDTPISGATDLGGGLFRFSNVSAIANGRRFTIGTTNVARTPLPVTLLEFTGESQPTGVRLRWSTASEQNSDFFQVERSPDLLTWSHVTTVPAAGESNSLISYEAFDPTTRTSLTYYRLKQVDQDDTFTFSPVISIASTEVRDIQLWPNPSSGILRISDPTGPMTSLRVLDSRGSLVDQYINVSTNTIDLDLSGHIPGVYFVYVESDRTSKQMRLVLAP